MLTREISWLSVSIASPFCRMIPFFVITGAPIKNVKKLSLTPRIVLEFQISDKNSSEH